MAVTFTGSVANFVSAPDLVGPWTPQLPSFTQQAVARSLGLASIGGVDVAMSAATGVPGIRVSVDGGVPFSVAGVPAAVDVVPFERDGAAAAIAVTSTGGLTLIPDVFGTAISTPELPAGLTPRRVTIHRIEVVSWQGAELVLDVSCSKGTYVRTLADDIGQALGCGAHLSALRRTAVGRLDVRDAVTPEALEALSDGERDARLRPADCLLADWPAVRLGADDAGRFLTGLRRRVAGDPAMRVYELVVPGAP